MHDIMIPHSPISSGLSQVQRIEQGNKPSMETCRALAAVFEVDLSQLQPKEETMLNEADLKFDEQEAWAYAKRIKEFYEYLITY